MAAEASIAAVNTDDEEEEEDEEGRAGVGAAIVGAVSPTVRTVGEGAPVECRNRDDVHAAAAAAARLAADAAEG